MSGGCPGAGEGTVMPCSADTFIWLGEKILEKLDAGDSCSACEGIECH